MSRMFGWNLPDGVTPADIDRAAGVPDPRNCPHGQLYYCDRCHDEWWKEDCRQMDALYDQDYLYIRAWGRFLGSSAEYIREEVETARRTHAPDQAIYKQDVDGERWTVYADIMSAWTKEQVQDQLRQIKKEMNGDA